MTFDAYARMLQRLEGSSRPISGVADYIRQPQSSKIILRHDVDRRPMKSLELAMLEHQIGVRSTYYFRISTLGRLEENTIFSISALGHEVGYHYETLSDCNGDFRKAIELFERNLARLRQICPCVTVSMHGRPLSKYNNEDLLRTIDFSAYGLIGDATLSVEDGDPIYFTDVGGDWNHPAANLRDYVGSTPPCRGDLDDAEFLCKVLKWTHRPLYISTHPERWSSGFFDSIYCRSRDMAMNTIKSVLRPGISRH